MKKCNFANINFNNDLKTFEISLKSPLVVCWQLNNKCNLKCKCCISDSSSVGAEGLSTRMAKKL